ncbi:DUF3667 domain-containing protein [Sphingomonas sp. RB56-2]|uniref:DUF3667 domain-containing protein n=1 Tax=Sphingomonas brevis TaxID=2908206 RepID=A0ABT0S898_9SPHN|nr:DUF3667 domain-containing protein [Sphingomonas brevis]MCL6740604.1 DUF3667 domain-containing protein [Sphingomonas brevis]
MRTQLGIALTAARPAKPIFAPTAARSRFVPAILTLRDLVTKLGQSISSIDGKTVRSFKALLAAPGTLAVAYVRGQRRVYLSPLKVFFIANALFFAAQSATHTNILSSSLESHLNQQDWKSVARPMVARHLEAEQLTLAEYAPVFDTAVVFYAKTLIILMTLCFAPFLAVAFLSERRPIGVHIVFSLHLYAFVLLLFCVSLGLTELDLILGGKGLASSRVDLVLSLFNLGACATYLYMAIGTAYGARGVSRIVKAAALACVVAAIVIGYRFLIFLITLWGS